MNTEYQKFIFKLLSGTIKERKQGTAFLISPKLAITAKHNLKPASAKNVTLEINNISHKVKVIPNKFVDIDAVILELENEIYGFCIPELDKTFDLKSNQNSNWETYGFPNNYHKPLNGKKILPVNDKLWDFDIDLEKTIEGYKGLSGAPVIVNDRIIGLITTDVPNDLLGVISVKKLMSIIDFQKISEENKKNQEILNHEQVHWNKIQEKCIKNKYYKLNTKEFQSFINQYPNGRYKKGAEEIIKIAENWFDCLKNSNFENFRLLHTQSEFTEADFNNRIFYLALKNIWVHGDTDIFPFPIENRIFKDRTEEVIAILIELDKNFTKYINNLENDINENRLFSYSLPKKSIIETAIPVGYTGFRWATQIEPIWNAYYLSLVLRIAQEIEKKRERAVFSESFFSYRFVPDYETGDIFKRRKGLQFWDKTENLLVEYLGTEKAIKIIKEYSNKIYNNQNDFENEVFKNIDISQDKKDKLISASRINVSDWLEFQRYSYEFVKKSTKIKYVVGCDIADFYNRINYKDLAETLEGFPEVNLKIISLLQLFSKGKTYSLPIGGNASRILAENMLFDFDYYLNDEHIEFSRFVDDYYIFAENEDDANKKLNNFYTYLLNTKGLSLQKHKIQIFTKSEFLNSIETRLFWKTEDPKTQDKARAMALARFDYYSENSENEEIEDPIKVEKLLNEELRKSRIHEQLANRLLTELNRNPNSNENPDEFNKTISKAYYSIFYLRNYKPEKENLQKTEKDKLLKLYPIFRKLLISIKYNIQKKRLVVINGKAKGSEKETNIDILELILTRLNNLYNDKSYVFDVDLHKAFLFYLYTKLDNTLINSTIKQFYKDEFNNSNSTLVQGWLLVNLLLINDDNWFRKNLPNFDNYDYWQKRIFLLSVALMDSIDNKKIDFNRLTEFEKLIFDWGKNLGQISELKKLL